MNTIRLNTIGEVVAKKTSGGAEINNQEKTIDITENGTTEVAPDNGFTGLSKVIINTDVQGGEGGGGESGSGGGSASGGSKWKYYDVSALDFNSDFGSIFAVLCHLVKQRQLGTGNIQFANSMGLYEGTPIMVAILLDYPTPNNLQSLAPTCGAMLETLPPDMATMIPEITEEEFYNLNA